LRFDCSLKAELENPSRFFFCSRVDVIMAHPVNPPDSDAGYGGNRADQLRVKNQFIYIDETFTRGQMKPY
jgi:hypothetical protein